MNDKGAWNMVRSRHGSDQCRASSGRLLVVAVTALALVAGWDHVSRATMTMGYTPWEVDASKRHDRRPPSRPEVNLVSIHRGRNPHKMVFGPLHREGAPDTLVQMDEVTEDANVGSLVISVRGCDDRTADEALGWRVRVATGAMPGLPLGTVGVEAFRSMAAGWHLLTFHWTDWTPEQPEPCCPLHAGLLVTCFDRAGNESEPSDTVWVDSPAR